MLIRAGYEIANDCPQPTPTVLMLDVHPSRAADLCSPGHIRFDPFVPSSTYRDLFGNVCTRIVAPPGRLTVSTDFLIEDGGLPDEHAPQAEQVPVQRLPDEALVFLMGSRSCETDLLSEVAWPSFGGTTPGRARVRAIVDFAHERITFGYPDARPTRTAWEAYQERRGVCRDFAHLALALCRCMNIPARYCTGYLGDIGVPPADAPMDFSAWFEVYLSAPGGGPGGGRWYTFDARHNRPRIGRVPMARGRDATDVALTTTFGQHALPVFRVITDEVPA